MFDAGDLFRDRYSAHAFGECLRIFGTIFWEFVRHSSGPTITIGDGYYIRANAYFELLFASADLRALRRRAGGIDLVSEGIVIVGVRDRGASQMNSRSHTRQPDPPAESSAPASSRSISAKIAAAL